MNVLGIDIGTTGCKAILVDADGTVLSRGYAGYGYTSYGDGRVEQDPEDWYTALVSATLQAVKGYDAVNITALALSTQGGSSCLLSHQESAMTPAITWMDSRAANEAGELDILLGRDYVYKTTGWSADAGLDMAKTRWLNKNEPELLAQAKYFISTIEYIQLRLTGVMSIDPTNAAMRQMMNIHTLKWDAAILDSISLDQDKLPLIMPVGTFLGPLTSRAAADLGLRPDTSVYQGAHDQYCGSLGATAFHPGDLMISTGTAWAILATVDHAVSTTTYISPGPHVLQGVYGAMATIPTGGAALDWLKSNSGDLSYADIDAHAFNSRERTANLLFYPYLNGAGYPIWQNKCKSSFIGMELHHTAADLAVSCMEGIAFQVRYMIEDFEKNNIPILRLKVIGGAANSAAWLAILEAVIRKPLSVVDVKDAPCIGAAAIAGVGCGMFADYDQALSLMAHLTEYPKAETAVYEYYEKKYLKFVRGMHALLSLEE